MFKRTKVSSALATAFGGALLVAGVPAGAQQQLERVEITGSAIKRIEAETTLPVTVITKEEIVKTGATTAAELLDHISANNGGGYNQSLAVGDAAVPGQAQASLRGLGGNATLILLNGRRIATYAFQGDGADLNAIALGAIERVEVLRDGASALYGTDAIAGVINFITRKDFAGIDLSANFRSPQDPGGKSKHGAVTAGFGDPAKDGFNVFANLTYDKYDSLKAKDREFSKTAFLPNAPGGPHDRTSGNTIPASIVVPGVGTVNPGVPNCLPPASFRRTPTDSCRFDYLSVIDILPDQEKIGGLVRGTLQLAPQHELFAEYSKTRTETTFRASPTPVSAGTTFNGNPVLYPAGGKWTPTAINPATGLSEPGVLWYAPDGSLTQFVPLSGDLNIFWRSLDAGPRTDVATADQDRIVLGAKGTIVGKYDYDTAYMKSVSKVTDKYVDGWLSETRLLNASCPGGTGFCGPTNPAYVPGTMNSDINPFGLNDATGLAALNTAKINEPIRESKSSAESVDGKIAGELMQLAAGAVGFALGAEYRREKFDDVPLGIFGSGDILGSGGNLLPVHGSRNVRAVFGEVVVPVAKGFELLGQLRYDNYSDVGSTTNPKLGVRWHAIPELLVRGSFGTGFRAPTMFNLYTPITQTNSGGSYNDPYYEARVGDCYDAAGNPTANFTPQFCSYQTNVRQGGNAALKPEESKQANLGIVLQPTRDISVGLDFWKIRIDKQIVIPDADQRLQDFLTPLLANPSAAYDPSTAKLTAASKAQLNAGLTGTGIVQNSTTGNLDYVSIQYDNISRTDTSGVDITIGALLWKSEFGDFRGTLQSTYVNSFKQDGVELVGKYQQYGPVVKWRHNANVDWTRGPWAAFVGYRYQSGYSDVGDTGSVDKYDLWDVGVAYRGVKNLTLRAGILNLLDNDPPFTRQTNWFQFAYDPTYADPRGRTFTLGLSYAFK